MRILLIEDHRDIAANIAEYFTAKGDSVQVAGDGPEGLSLAQLRAHDVIVLDLMLPGGIDGIEVCRRLRASSDAHTPILMLTARDLLADKVSGLDAGADDYLVKPFSLLELAARLRALVRRTATPERQMLEVADLQYDLQTLNAVRDGQTLKLNPTTRRILALLMQHSHRVVSREELEQHLWGNERPGPDVLRAHVHALRTAVDKDHAIKLVHTIHGTGYRLSLPDESNA
jgi:DNA-binding response OmpR family regulator